LNILFYVIITVIIILTFILTKNKGILVTLLCSILILYIILNPHLCINAAVSGALLFFYKVFPSLFPFVVLSNMIMYYDGVSIYSRLLGKALCKPLKLPEQCSFVLIISTLCGYPLGAKYACELYERDVIQYSTCERLLNIASNPSPLFIIGAVGTSMLGKAAYGYILLVSAYLSCIAMGILLPSKHIVQHTKIIKNNSKIDINFGNAMKESIEGAIKTCFSVCGYVTIFSVINNIIKSSIFINTALGFLSDKLDIQLNVIQGTLLGVIEMTNGCNEISATQVNITVKLGILSFLLAFSGISVISQVYSFTSKDKFPLKKYIRLKLVQGIICSIITILILKCLNFGNVSVFSFMCYQNTSAVRKYSILGEIIIFLILTAPIMIMAKSKKSFHSF
jgi:sporulation integral membrane protein YlbJ